MALIILPLLDGFEIGEEAKLDLSNSHGNTENISCYYPRPFFHGPWSMQKETLECFHESIHFFDIMHVFYFN